jgi:type VI secretion system secreted protein Hcp
MNFPLARTAFVCAALVSSLPAAASSDYFLKFDGIDGSSVQKGHEKAIEFNAFSWGVSIAPSRPGTGAGKPVFSDFFWSQNLDASVNGLFNNATSGNTIKNATVDFTSLIGGQNQTYFRMSFEGVFLTSLNLSGSTGSIVGLDGSFAYDKVTLDYWTQDVKSGKLVQSPSASYDLIKGQGSLSALTALYAQGLSGPQVSAVPEPENYAMLLAGLGLIGVVALRRFGRV